MPNDANGASRCAANNDTDASYSGSVWLNNVAKSMLESGAEGSKYRTAFSFVSTNKEEEDDDDDGKWTCTLCTFCNENNHLQCNMCYAVRGEMNDSIWDDSPASKEVAEFVSLSDIWNSLLKVKPHLSADLIESICEMIVPPAVDESKYPTKPTF